MGIFDGVYESLPKFYTVLRSFLYFYVGIIRIVPS